ncbi:MAG: hypothetical protein OXG80_01635 [Chloroflexi bacterium]|nr:hypothetical protein [Chloroflexota bacterium]
MRLSLFYSALALFDITQAFVHCIKPPEDDLKHGQHQRCQCDSDANYCEYLSTHIYPLRQSIISSSYRKVTRQLLNTE